jgi:hypothetical protein
MLINVVALSRFRVALNVVVYDAKVGTDSVEGGAVLLMSLANERLGQQTRAT